jgi:hypothetical protein
MKDAWVLVGFDLEILARKWVSAGELEDQDGCSLVPVAVIKWNSGSSGAGEHAPFFTGHTCSSRFSSLQLG